MSGFVSKMAVQAPSWILVHPVINIRKINRLPVELFKKVSRQTKRGKRRNNRADLSRTHLSSAKNCFQAPPRSLCGVNYLLMRDVLVTFMYVLLAGGNCARSQCDAASQSGPHRPGPPAVFFVWLLARAGPALLTRLVAACLDDACPVRGPSASAQNRQPAQTTPRI